MLNLLRIAAIVKSTSGSTTEDSLIVTEIFSVIGLNVIVTSDAFESVTTTLPSVSFVRPEVEESAE